MKRLPVGIQNFGEIQTGNYLYIDKTAQVFRLIDEGKYYFLSRPRRFGKSLLLSTLEAVFQRKKELFKGLYIEDKWNWDMTYPVIHLSFNTVNYKTAGLEKALHYALDKQAAKYGFELNSIEYDAKFEELIQTLAKKNKVALLIDEYDKPLIDYLDKENLHQAKAHQKILKNFYSVIKDSDQYLKFLFITGVSKFSKVSIFSDLNHLRDITFERHYAAICGYTQTELEDYFAPYENETMSIQEIDRATLYKKIKTWYNGYSWDARTRLYNPFSILRFFASSEFRNYWFSTGTPTFLINLLKERFIYDFNEVETSHFAIESYDLDHLDTLPLLLQTGYLTVKSQDEHLVVLTYPNSEVKASMLGYLLAGFRHSFPSTSTPIVHKVHLAFKRNDMEAVMQQINYVFSTIPNIIFQAKTEGYYQSLIHLTFTYLGIYLQSEVNTSRGRCDTVVYTDTHVYILEFKLDKPVEKALEQITKKAYIDAFKAQHPNKTIVKVGISFDSSKKEVGDWKIIE